MMRHGFHLEILLLQRRRLFKHPLASLLDFRDLLRPMFPRLSHQLIPISRPMVLRRSHQ